VARLSDIPPGDLAKGPIADLRQADGDAQFAKELESTSAEIHARAGEAWRAGDRATHDKLIDYGWLLARHEKREVRR